MKYTIGLDYGTKSGRAVIVEVPSGKQISAAVKEYAHGVIDDELEKGLKLPANWALQNPEDYLDVLRTIVPQVIKDASVEAKDIIGIAIDFTSCTMLPIDNQGNPLCFQQKYRNRPHAYAKLWKHHASQWAADEITKVLEECGELYKPRYGGKISSELMIPKILQILEEDPEIYNEASEFLEAMDWLTLKLTGKHRRSISGAGYKAMYSPEEGYPSKEILRKINPKFVTLIEDKMSRDICGICEKFGELNAEWASILGLMPGTAVAAGIIDSHVGLAGCGVTKPGELMLIIGTSSVLLTLSEKPYSKNGIVGAFRGGIIPEYYALESGLASVGDQLEWYIKNCVPYKYIREADEKGQTIHDYLSEKASKIGAGNTGLLVLDWWSGNKTPYVNGELSGVIVGLNMRTKPEELYQAIIESTAYGTYLIIEAMEEAGVKIDTISACGGITNKNNFFMQIYADVTNRRIKIQDSKQTAAVGAAMYAAVAAGSANGGYDSIKEAAIHMSGTKKKQFIPNNSNHKKYMKIYQEYKNVSDYFGRYNSDIFKIIKKSSKEEA